MIKFLSIKKATILNNLGVFYIVYGIFAIEYAIYRNKPEWALWFCYIGLVVIGFAMLTRNSKLIASQLNLLIVYLAIWNIDFFSRLITGQHIFGTTKYFYEDHLLWPARLVSLEHFFLVPLALVAMYLIAKKIKYAWIISVIQGTTIYVILKLFTSGEHNVNCAFESCFPYVPNDDIYSIRWFVLFLSIIAITQFVLGIFVFLVDKRYNK